MILLAWMATGYKYVDYTTGEGVTKDVEDNDETEVSKTEKESIEWIQYQILYYTIIHIS